MGFRRTVPGMEFVDDLFGADRSDTVAQLWLKYLQRHEPFI